MFKVAPPEMRKSNRCFCVSMDNFRLEHQLKASNFSFENYLLGRKRRLKVAGTFKKFVYWPWSPVCIYWPSPTILLPARGLSLNILTLSPQFVFVFAALAHDLYYGPWPEFAFTLLLVVIAVVVVIVVVVTSLEQIVPIFVCRF